MKNLRQFRSLMLIGGLCAGIATLSGCVAVPADGYYGDQGGYYGNGSQPVYSEPYYRGSPVYVAPSPVYIDGGIGYYSGYRRPYDPFYGVQRPSYVPAPVYPAYRGYPAYPGYVPRIDRRPDRGPDGGPDRGLGNGMVRGPRGGAVEAGRPQMIRPQQQQQQQQQQQVQQPQQLQQAQQPQGGDPTPAGSVRPRVDSPRGPGGRIEREPK